MVPSNGLKPTTADTSLGLLLNLSMLRSVCFITSSARPSAEISRVESCEGFTCRALTALTTVRVLEEEFASVLEPLLVGLFLAPTGPAASRSGAEKVAYDCSTIPVLGGEHTTCGLIWALENRDLHKKQMPGINT